MSHLKLFPGVDLANSLSRLTGKSYENSLHELNRIDRPSVTDGLGNLDLTAFRDLSRSHFASDTAICKEVGRITGSGFESTFIKMNMPKIGK